MLIIFLLYLIVLLSHFWPLKSLHKSHRFVNLPLQSACRHGILGFCLVCHQAMQKAAMAACNHSFSLLNHGGDPKLVGTACDLASSNAIHYAFLHTDSIVYYCQFCHAISCANCITG